MSDHATFSPSSMSRVEACPGSWRHNLGRKSTSSAYAVEGSVAHALAEQAMKRFVPLSKIETVQLKDHKDPFPITDEMRGFVQVYIDHVEKLSVGAKAIALEKKVTVIDGKMYGTADAVIVKPNEAIHVVDLKYGVGHKVDPVENVQCAAYMLGVLRWVPKSGATTGYIHIVQPRVDDEPKMWVIPSLKQFEEEWTQKFAEIVALAESADAPFAVGDHCSFCPGKLDCAELRRVSTEIAIAKFATVENVDTVELVKFIKQADAVRLFLKAVEQELETRAAAGETVPGHKIVETWGNRKWTDEATIEVTCELLGLEDAHTKKLKSPAQIEKDLGKLMDKKQAKDLVAGFCTRERTGRKLVAEDDKRPAALTAETAFAD